MTLDLKQIPVFQEKEWARFDLTLTRIKRALDKIEVKPPKETILVAGTNGKGTVSLNLARHWSDRVGLFMSPHVLDLRERVTVAGNWFSSDLWVKAYQRTSQVVQDDELSYFEWMLVLALIMFEEESVDKAVFEVGLGGRWDATNALDPFLSVLTNVELDHQQILGSTRPEIALEKIEIARPNRPFFLPDYALEWPKVRERVAEINCELKPIKLSSPSSYEENQVIVDAVLHYLNRPKIPNLLKPLGRRSMVLPEFWVDGAHNEAGWLDCVKYFENKPKVTLIAGLTEGRDPQCFIHTFSPIADSIFTVAKFDRALPIEKWPKGVRNLPENWLDLVGQKPILVCGSLYAVGYILKTLMQNELLDEKRIMQASFQPRITC